MGKISELIVVMATLAAFGAFGCFMERRRHRAEGGRGVPIWYWTYWPFAATAACAVVYQRLHWLIYVSSAIAALSYVVQILEWRRAARTRTRPGARADADKP